LTNNSIPSHFPEADGIRGLACLMVLFVHITAITFPETHPYLRGTGKIGVWLFFQSECIFAYTSIVV